ncbi:MAG: SAM-dependent chlorinase/fluorinase [Verrucomicrobia bacterium]|nr:SAM-dependent chlorinase/fluorinase [Verrucomicrobiota bacterium]
MPIITILTDFGSEDYFVGAMKGVMLARNPHAVLVDVTHGIPPQDIRAGAFTLAASYPYFPSGSIHLAVVDPGVGSDRRPLVIEAGGHRFAGPDNGLFSLVLDHDPAARVRHATNSEFFLAARSSTFHGRDIFAPVCAALSLGVAPERFGPIVTDPVRFRFTQVEVAPNGAMLGAILHVDHFGNCVTNLTWDLVREKASGRSVRLQVREVVIERLLTYYGEASERPLEPFLIVGSAGFLEISLCCSSAARQLNIGAGEPVRLTVGNGSPA